MANGHESPYRTHRALWNKEEKNGIDQFVQRYLAPAMWAPLNEVKGRRVRGGCVSAGLNDDTALGPEGEEIVITKHRVSSFAGTELELLLRAKEIDTLILFGLSTGDAVLSTVLDASDADYKLIVISDCCADCDGELHDVLVTRLFPYRGEVLTASQFIQALQLK